jgi:maleylacetoacetate isomerase
MVQLVERFSTGSLLLDHFGARRAMKLYDFPFSNASTRVRIVFYLKNISYERVDIDLLRCTQEDGSSFLRLNSQGMVPTVVHGDLVLSQSIAIAEYLDEIFPTPRLLPSDVKARARVRALALMIACDGQPIVNLRIRRFLTNELGFSRQKMVGWVQRWLTISLKDYETTIGRDPVRGVFSHGDEPTLADAFLVPQVLLAKRFEVDLTPYVSVTKIYQRCMLLEPFQKAAAEYIIEDAEYGLKSC